METKLKILIGLIVIGLASSLWLGMAASVSQVTYVTCETPKELVTHAQKVWISALEWCESKGRPEAVNKKDRDGTPSYYSFQFKPDTFRYYGEKYGTQEPGLSDKEIQENMQSQEAQQLIVEHMVADQKNIKWEQQFPMCVKKIGRPPVY